MDAAKAAGGGDADAVVPNRCVMWQVQVRELGDMASISTSANRV